MDFWQVQGLEIGSFQVPKTSKYLLRFGVLGYGLGVQISSQEVFGCIGVSSCSSGYSASDLFGVVKK